MAKYKLLLPKMGESVAEATVIRWTKKPGERVDADETVMEIATDKVDSDVPSPVSGILLEQLYKDNDVVQVGAVIAIIETAEPEQAIDPPKPAAPVFEAPKPAPEPIIPSPPPVVEAPKAEIVEEKHESVFYEAPEPEPSAEAPAETVEPEPKPAEEPKPTVFAEQREEFTPPVPYVESLEPKEAPKAEETPRVEGRFYSPLVKNIAAQEGIGNDELDKIPGTGAEGRLTKDDLLAYIQKRYEPAPAPEAAPINEIADEEPSAEPAEAPAIYPIAEAGSFVAEDPVAPAAEPPAPEPVVEAPVAPAAEPPAPEPVVEASEPDPVVEKPQLEPLFEIPQTEPVKQSFKQQTEPVGRSLSGGDEIIEMDRMGRIIAEHMVMSKHTSPHVTSFVEADVTNLVLWRDKVKGAFEKREGEKITFTPLFIEAVVRSIKDMPMINVQVNGTQIIKKKDINISMATALPNGNLIVPVIKRADELSIIGLTKAVNDLASRARNNKLKPDDVQGGTFTITNVGSFGNVMGTPIINQPQVAILAVGAIRKKPAVIETLQGDLIGIRHMMFLSLSYDHRVVNGALGGSFVRRVADYLENWDPGREI